MEKSPPPKIEADAAEMLDELMSKELRLLISMSYVVLCNNQVTNRFIEERYDMPVHTWSALYAIVTFPGLRARDIQALFPRPQNTISRAVNLLVQRGYVDEAASKDDARAKILLPTQQGRALLKEILAIVERRQEEIFAPLDEGERQAFLALCRKIATGPKLISSEAMQ